MLTQGSDLEAPLGSNALRVHALKNCAASISVLCQLVTKNGAAEPRHLRRLEEAAARMMELLTESLERPSEALNVSELLRFVRRQVEPRAQDGKVELFFSHISASVRCSAHDLGEALLNLVENAVEATPPGGHVRVVHTAARAERGRRLPSCSTSGTFLEAERLGGRVGARTARHREARRTSRRDVVERGHDGPRNPPRGLRMWASP